MVFTDNRGYLRRMMADLLILLKANSLPSIDANLFAGYWCCLRPIISATGALIRPA